MKKLIPLLSLLLFSACDMEFIKVIDVELGRGPDELVIYSMIGPEYNIYVDVFETKTIQSSAFHAPLNDATVRLFENGNSLDTLDYLDGRYWSNYRPNPSSTYQFEVRQGGRSIDFELEFPPLVPIADLEFSSRVVNEDIYYSYRKVDLRITFEDPIDPNHYMLHLERKFSPTADFTPIYLSSNDATIRQEHGSSELFIEEDGEVYAESPLIFSDDLFDATSKTLTLSFDTSVEPHDIILRVSLFSVNEGIYRFFKELDAQNQSLQNPFAEPISLDGYVPNGLGLVGAWQKSVIHRTIVINEN